MEGREEREEGGGFFKFEIKGLLKDFYVKRVIFNTFDLTLKLFINLLLVLSYKILSIAF